MLSFIIIGVLVWFLIGFDLDVDNTSVNVVTKLLLPVWGTYATILIFSIFFGHLFGGADSKLLYAVSFGWVWWLSPEMLAIGVIIGSVLQLLVHWFGGRIGLGTQREIPRSGLSKAWYYITHHGVKAADTKVATAMPFLPALVIGLLGSLMVAVA